MKARPRIADGVQITPLETPDGLRYRLSPGRRGAGSVVPARTLPLLLLMTGRATLEQIHRSLDELSFRIPDPAKMIEMVRLFEAAGVIEVTHDLSTVGPLHHECEGCGQSCEGHLVGPIEEEEGSRLEHHLEELRAQDASIPPGPATTAVHHDGKRHRVLHFPDGVCVFLDANKRCRLHSRYGSTSKPLPCRMFPFRVVRTEAGTRVAISPRCFRAHHSFQSGLAWTPEKLFADWEVWRPPGLVQGLNGEHPESLVRTPVYEENLAHEHEVLKLLKREDFSLASLLGRLAHLNGSGQPDSHSEPNQAARGRFGTACFSTLLDIVNHFSLSDDEPKSRFGQGVEKLIGGIRGLKKDTLDDWNDLPRPAKVYARHCLEHLVFAREVMISGSVRAGVLSYSMGLMAARWLCPREDLEQGELDEFSTFATAWMRISSAPELQRILFPSGSAADNLLKHLIDANHD